MYLYVIFVCLCVFGISHRGANIKRVHSAGGYTQECLFLQRLLSEVLLCSFSTKKWLFLIYILHFVGQFRCVLKRSRPNWATGCTGPLDWWKYVLHNSRAEGTLSGCGQYWKLVCKACFALNLAFIGYWWFIVFLTRPNAFLLVQWDTNTFYLERQLFLKSLHSRAVAMIPLLPVCLWVKARITKQNKKHLLLRKILFFILFSI